MLSRLCNAAAISSILALVAVVRAVPIDLEERTKPTPNQVYLRIEGESNTIYEGLVYRPYGREITTPSGGGPHLCDGTNNGANPTPGPTATTALDQAAKRAGFAYDGTWESEFNDFFITSIGDSTETSTQFWGVLVDGQFLSGPTCSYEVPRNHKVLWAFDAFNAQYFLGLALDDPHNIYAGQPFTATVTDIMTGNPISGAQVADQISDSNGQVTLQYDFPSKQSLKAEKTGSIRSNRVQFRVRPHAL